MSLRSTILSAVDTAFTAAGDLVKTATFRSKTNVSYDFSTGSYSSQEEELQIPALLVEENRGVDSPSEAKSQVIVKTETIDFSLYSQVGISGAIYRIESYQTYPGVTILEVVK